MRGRVVSTTSTYNSTKSKVQSQEMPQGKVLFHFSPKGFQEKDKRKERKK